MDYMQNAEHIGKAYVPTGLREVAIDFTDTFLI